MKKILLLLVVVFAILSASAQKMQYYRIRTGNDPATITALQHSGIPLEGITSKEKNLNLDISAYDLAKLTKQGIPYEIIIEDVSSFYAKRAAQATGLKSIKASSDYAVPAGFSLGSCGGFYTVNEMLAQLDSMAARFPNLISVRQPVSPINTIEGRQVFYVKISDNPGVNENEPQVLYTGMHHAREPIGMQHLLFYMYYLLENYATNEDIRNLVNNTEMYFVPIFNVDGYLYNISTDPNGGGMWRKNRRNNGDGSYGIDINRNYGFMWGLDDSGSSPYSSDETYRGTAGFSEPETQMIRDFCNSHNFRIAVNYHSYADDLLYAWGYTPELTPDENLFSSYAIRMTADNSYLYGPGNTTIYPTNGGSDDWMYGEQSVKNKILAYTPEIGNQNDGFWPSPDRIIPLCQENMLQSILAARFVGQYAELKDASPAIAQSDTGYFHFNLKRLGLIDTAIYTVSLLPLSANITAMGTPKVFSGLGLLETINDSVSYSLSPEVHEGDVLKFLLVLDNGLYQNTDTISKIYGHPLVIFEDLLGSASNWTGNWALTASNYHSGPKSMTDSPSGNYANNTNKSCTLVTPIDLSHAATAMLSFWARWNTEAGYDYVQVKISGNNGVSWTPMAGRYTKTGNASQATGEPLYDGINTTWVKEEIDLRQFAGQHILIRFTLISDGGVVADGFYFDDLTVNVINLSTEIKDTENLPESIMLSNPKPNPASTVTTISYSLPQKAGKGRVMVYAADGHLIGVYSVRAGSHDLQMDISSWPAGIFYYRLTAAGGNSEAKKLIVTGAARLKN